MSKIIASWVGEYADLLEVNHPSKISFGPITLEDAQKLIRAQDNIVQDNIIVLVLEYTKKEEVDELLNEVSDRTSERIKQIIYI